MSEWQNAESLDAVELTRALCEIVSTTYYEGEVGEFLAGFLAGRGWEVEKTAVEQSPEGPAEGKRWNIYAGVKGQQPVLVFSTHMDTVPPYIPFREDGEYLYGRGTCDAKGIMAAQIVAAEALRKEGLPVAMLFVSGEERDSAGSKAANLRPKGNRYLINGEPTDNKVALASKGALRAVFTAKGKAAHSAYPELGESAIHKLIAVLDRVMKLDLPVLEDVGPSTINIGQIEGGHAPNVIADHAQAQVLVRLVDDTEKMRKLLRDAAGSEAEVNFTLDIPFVRLKSFEGLPTMVAKFTTDIPMLTNWGEPLLVGPGSIHVAHTSEEKLAKKELFEAIDLYIEIGRRLLK